MAKVKTKILKVKIEAAVLDALEKLLSARGSDVGTLARMQLKAFVRARRVLGLRDIMSFGKYHGEKVEDVVRTDPGYVQWCVEQDSMTTKFGTDVMQLLDNMTSEEIPF